MNAVVYARYSSHKQGEQSIEGQLATNVKRGMDIAASKGQSVGGTIPLGYRTGADKHLEPGPETAPLVKRIFEMYAAGSTQKEIIDSLNAEGLRTRKGKPLTVNSIRAVLKNKKYMGVFHYNGKEYPDAYIPALIDAETFEKVQRVLVQNRKAPAKKWTKAEYLLTGKLFCGLCGQTMIGESGTGKSGTRYHYYNCLGKKNHRTCKKRAVRKNWIEELVLTKAKAVVMSDEMIDFIAQKTHDYYVEQNTDTSYTDSLHAELDRVNAATTNLIRAMEAGILTTPPGPVWRSWTRKRTSWRLLWLTRSWSAACGSPKSISSFSCSNSVR